MNVRHKKLCKAWVVFCIIAAAIGPLAFCFLLVPVLGADPSPRTDATQPSGIFDVDKDLDSAPAASNAPPAETGVTIFAEGFNDSSTNIELKNGAILGPAGSGVSGKDNDRAYTADVTKLGAPQDGPVALIKKPVSVQGLEEATVCLWYKPAVRQVANVTLFDAGSMTSLWGDLGWTFRLSTKTEKRVMYWFSSGTKGGSVRWLQPGDWVFLAGVWKKSANEITFYQGTKVAAVKKSFTAVRHDSTGGLIERGDRDKRPEAIGNHASTTYERPFNGSIDDFRIYSMPLDEGALEKIRQADMKNEAPPAF